MILNHPGVQVARAEGASLPGLPACPSLPRCPPRMLSWLAHTCPICRTGRSKKDSFSALYRVQVMYKFLQTEVGGEMMGCRLSTSNLIRLASLSLCSSSSYLTARHLGSLPLGPISTNATASKRSEVRSQWRRYNAWFPPATLEGKEGSRLGATQSIGTAEWRQGLLISTAHAPAQ